MTNAEFKSTYRTLAEITKASAIYNILNTDFTTVRNGRTVNYMYQVGEYAETIIEFLLLHGSKIAKDIAGKFNRGLSVKQMWVLAYNFIELNAEYIQYVESIERSVEETKLIDA